MFMSAAVVVNSVEFAQAGQEVEGRIPVANMERLAGSLYGESGDIRYRIRGSRDERGHFQLRLRVTGELVLQCQRCLGEMKHPLDLENILMLDAPGEPVGEIEIDPAAPDSIEASTQLDVLQLVEEEILLALPYAPRHDEQMCPVGKRDGSTEIRNRAFAKLADLHVSRKKT